MDKSIETSVGQGNVIHISIVGDLLEDTMDSLVASLGESVQVIIDAYNTAGQKKVKVLVDLSQFSGKYVIKSF